MFPSEAAGFCLGLCGLSVSCILTQTMGDKSCMEPTASDVGFLRKKGPGTWEGGLGPFASGT